MGKKAVSVAKYLASAALAVVLVYLAFRKVDMDAFIAGLRQTRWSFIALFALASVLALVFRMLRWRALLSPIVPRPANTIIWDSANVGNLTNIAIPGSGEFVRCGYASSGLKTGYDKVFGTILMERIWDLFAIAVIFALALGAGWSRFGEFFTQSIWTPLRSKLSLSGIIMAAAVVAVIAASVWALMHLRGKNRLADRMADAVTGIGRGFASIRQMQNKWLFAAYTAGIWASYILMSWAVLKAMPDLQHLGIADTMFISAVGNIASIIPVPGGIGAYHYLVTQTLSSLYGAAWETGILFATLNHELHAVLIILLGVISYINLSIRRK